MKTRILFLLPGLLLGYGMCHSQSQILIDFGNDASYRGASVPNPDPNGNYWNSVWSGAYYANLLDLTGNATVIDFGFSAASGTDYFNGPSGATQDPAATVYDAIALGNLGVNEAVYDYYVNSTFEIQGLDPAKTYDLAFYGAHQFNADNETVYSVYSDNTYTTVVGSVNLAVHQAGSPWIYNQDTVATITGLAPQTGNILYVRFMGAGGNEGYLNAMQITEVPEPAAFAALLGLAGLGLALYRRRRS